MSGADLSSDLLAAVNAAPDILSAKSASEEILSQPDTRAAVLLAPQLHIAHHLSNALEYWAHQKYSDAHRWFWAVLRRQIALGSATSSRHTKAFFGRSIIDQLQAQIGRDRAPQDFWMGARLLMESGLPDIADKTTWTEKLVESYVDANCVAATVAYAGRAQGAARERTLVALVLFKRWLLVLAPDASAVAKAMLQFLAASAKGFEWSFSRNQNLSSASLEALNEVGRTRPEFRLLAADAVVNAVISKLADRDFNAVSNAIETAQGYLDVLDHRGLAAVVTALLATLERFGGGNGPWPVVRPALALLGSPQVMSLCNQDPELGAKVPPTLLRFSLETETENTSLLFLLRDIDPALIEGQVDAARLEAVVSDIRRRAGEINSSAATANIVALLVAPR